MRVCTICSHPQRKEIEACVTKGESLRRIAAQFGVGSESTLRRHKKCIVPVLQRAEAKRELGTIATVKETLEVLSRQMRADVTDLFDEHGGFDVLEIRRRGLGPMLKSITFRQERAGTRVEDVVRVETHSQQGAAQALLKAYTQLEITKQLIDARLLSDGERAERIAALVDRARARRAGSVT